MQIIQSKSIEEQEKTVFTKSLKLELHLLKIARFYYEYFH